MQATDITNPNERKKLIGAIVLGLLALVLLWWAFIGFGSSSQVVKRSGAQPTPVADNQNPPRPLPASTTTGLSDDALFQLQPLLYEYSAPAVPEAKRNIFAFYEPPPPTPVVSTIPTPTPTPTPPVLLASLSPASVFARTSDFTLEVSGDKFVPGMRVQVDNNEMQTRYLSPQQLSATIPAVMISNPGVRQIMLRTPDGKLYSNVMGLNVAAPPIPNYTYVGIIGTRRYIDTAILQDKGNREMLNVQRGDLLGGRFKVNSISEKEVVLVDNNLKIKHTLAFTTQGDRGNPLQRPTPRVESEDDEP